MTFQPIPSRWRHGNIRLIRVRYRHVGDAAAWNSVELSGSSLSVELPTDVSLVDDKFHEVIVDAQTEVGFNDSLHLESVILPTSATGMNGFRVGIAGGWG